MTSPRTENWLSFVMEGVGHALELLGWQSTFKV